ncbi:MAG: hypothetical protein IJ300_03440 [Clostridia bacterium]|nr:hypothetical protein [Clostridia bacterium]
MTKKLISLIISAASILSAVASVSAANVGDVIGTVYNTDIVAYINNYAIPSYAANGTSVVVAEDLRNFGFDVVWNGEARTLTISRNEITQPAEMKVMKTGQPSTKFADLLYTDIKVYGNGIQLPSYAINGYTMVPVEALTMFGTCNWVSEERALKLWIDNVHIREEKQAVDNISEVNSVVNACLGHLMNYDIKSAMSYTTNWSGDYQNLDDMINDIVVQSTADGILTTSQAERFAKAIFAKMISANSYTIDSVEKLENGYLYNITTYMASTDFPNEVSSVFVEQAAEKLIMSGKITERTSESRMMELLFTEIINMINEADVETEMTVLPMGVQKIDGNWTILFDEQDL